MRGSDLVVKVVVVVRHERMRKEDCDGLGVGSSHGLKIAFMRQPSTRTSNIAAHRLHFLYACIVCILLHGV